MTDVNTLITYGGGQILQNVFNGVAMAVGDTGYKSVIRLVLLFSLLWIVIEVAIQVSYIKLLTWMGSFFLLLNLLLVPKMTVVIEDKLSNDAVYTVDNVPLGVAYFATIASQIGYVLTSLCDEVFSLPDDLQYSQTGLVMGSRLVSDAMRFQITDPTLSENVTSFMQQCVFYDLLLGKYSASDLFSSTDIWNFITQNASPARAFKYINASGGNAGTISTILTCQEGVTQLNSDWSKEIEQAATVYGQRFFETSNVNAKSELLSRLPIAFNYLTNTSQSAEQIMMQAMTANAIQHALLGNGAESGASAAVGQYAATRAEQMQMSKFLVTGDLAAHWLAIMQNVIEALLYGGFILVVLTMLLPSGHKVILHYLQTLLWVQLWAPLYAILNLVMTMGASYGSMAAIANTSGASAMFTLNTYAGLGKVNADMAAFAGFATMSIPLIAWGMVKMTGLAVTVLASSLSSMSQSIASQVGSEITSGNMSYGNLQYQTQSAYNTSANSFNTNASYQAGMSSYQAPSGALIQHTLDGSTVINAQGAISSTGTSINLAGSMREQATLQAENAMTQAQTQMKAYSEAMSNAFRGVMEFSKSTGNSSSHDNTWAQGNAANISDSADNVSQSVQRFAMDHHLSTDQAVRVLGEAYAKVNAGVGIPGVANLQGGLTASLSDSANHVSGDTWRAATDFVSQESFRHNADTILRASHDEHLKMGNDEASRLLHNISSSYDNALSARSEISSSLSEANSLRKTASFAEENALAVNTNASQSLVNWMMEQPDGHGGQLGAVGTENILNSQPALAQEYANQFAASEVAKMASHFNQSSTSEQALTQAYQQSSEGLSGTASIVNSNQAHNSMIQTAAQQAGLSGHGVDDNLKTQVTTTMNDAEKDRRSTQGNTEQDGNYTKNGTLAKISAPTKLPPDMTLKGELGHVKDLSKNK